MENPFFNRDINEICAICLNAHGYNGTSSLLTMLPVEEPVEAYKALESMSQYKYNIKGPQYLCANCFQMASFLNAFQRMCNKAQWYFDNYIRYQNESNTSKTVLGQISSVATLNALPQNSLPINNLGNTYSFLDSYGPGQHDNRVMVIQNVHYGEQQSSENNCIFGANNIKQQEIKQVKDEQECNLQNKKMRLLQYSSQTKPGPPNCQEEGDIGQENSNDSFGNDGDFAGGLSDNDDDFVPENHQEKQLSTGPLLSREKKKRNSTASKPKKTLVKRPCRFCYEKFKTFDDRDEHEKNVHSDEKTYTCELCNMEFYGRKKFHMHQNRHKYFHRKKLGIGTLIVTISCPVCNKRFFTEDELKEHEGTHTADEIHKCQICSKIFATTRSLGNHVEKHKDSKHTCPTCKTNFVCVEDLKQHIDTVAECKQSEDVRMELLDSLRCEICSIVCNSTAYLNKTHRLSHEKTEPVTCDICNRQLTNEFFLRRHKRARHGASTQTKKKALYKCKYCDKSFQTRTYLHNVHYRVHESTSDEANVCRFCGKTFFDKYTLRKHEMTHTGEKNYKCDYCEKRFTTITQRIQHHLAHITTKSNPCNVCGKLIKGEKYLRIHMRKNHPAEFEEQTGTKIEFFPCDVCDQKLRSVTWLERHKREKHSGIELPMGAEGEKPKKAPPPRMYKCESCKKTFKYQTMFLKHRRAHRERGEGPTCKVCGKIFSSALALQRHEMTHTGEKNYKCDYCDKHFITIGQRTVHHRVHLVKESSTCNVCGKLFKGERNLNAHMRSKHPVEFEAQTGTKITFYSCNICHKKLRSDVWLERHKQEKHPRNEPNEPITKPRTPRPPRRPQVEPVLHKCELCSAVFKNLAYFQKHQRAHSEKDEDVK